MNKSKNCIVVHKPPKTPEQSDSALFYTLGVVTSGTYVSKMDPQNQHAHNTTQKHLEKTHG